MELAGFPRAVVARDWHRVRHATGFPFFLAAWLRRSWPLSQPVEIGYHVAQSFTVLLLLHFNVLHSPLVLLLHLMVLKPNLACTHQLN